MMTHTTNPAAGESQGATNWAHRSPQPLSLDGRVAVVTGSSRGIGEAVARAFAATGAAVVVSSSHSRDAGEAVAADLPQATYVEANVASADDTAALIDAALAKWGRIDALVNCAGLGRRVPFEDLDGADDELWRQCLEVHVMGAWNTTRAAARALRAYGEGSVTNVTSIAASTITGNSIPYTVSKAGAEHLTLLLARALAPAVRVNAVAPGFIRTPLTASLPADYIAAYEQRIPLGHGGEPADIASACLFLATCRFVTGTVLGIDGGVRIR